MILLPSFPAAGRLRDRFRFYVPMLRNGSGIFWLPEKHGRPQIETVCAARTCELWACCYPPK